MRLINTATLVVEEFNPRDVPPYAILSHTWEEEEMSLQEMRFTTFSTKKGYTKIKNCCAQAAADGFTHCWIDTCCIDKTSSAELSEAINSMFQWYRQSSICYALLSDCFGDCRVWDEETVKHFADSRWWTRGWTLQELLAPKVVEFYNAEWCRIGSRNSLRTHVSHASGIDEDILGSKNVTTYNVAVRMSWAAQRQTTRIEDQAYCLMGLFNVNMPLLYGEGVRAFARLQEEILRVTGDYSLFLWQMNPVLSSCALFADSPADFSTRLEVDEWSFRWHRRTISPSGRHHSVRPADFASSCSRSFPLPNSHGPPSIASRAVRLHLPIVHTRGYSIVCLSETKFWLPKDGFLVCLLVSKVWSPVGSRDSLVLVQKRMRSRFKYETIHLTNGALDRLLSPHHADYCFALLILKYDTSKFNMLSTSLEKAVEIAIPASDPSLESLLGRSDPYRGSLTYKTFPSLPESRSAIICMQRDPSDCFVLDCAPWHGSYPHFTFKFNGSANLEQTFLLSLAIEPDQAYCRLEHPSDNLPEYPSQPLANLEIGAKVRDFTASHHDLTLTTDRQHTTTDPDRGGPVELTVGVRSVAPIILHGSLCPRYVVSLAYQLTPASAQNDQVGE